MTDLLDRAIERVRALPPEMQDDFAKVLLQLTGEEQPIYAISPAEESSFELARAQSARGEFASDGQMQAIWAKHGL